jgi:nicotinamide mononucleotide transporter
MLNWLIENYIEILGTVLSIAYLLLSIRQNILLWPMGILSAVLYVIVFFQAKFYADMGLNVYYLLISIYGWATWVSAKNKTGVKMPVKNIRGIPLVLSVVAIALLFVGIGLILDNFTDSPLPYWDALTTSGSIVATWMLTRKYIEHWILWVVIDLISLGLYIYKGLYPTSVLFIVYSVMAVVGYRQWDRKLKTEA